MQMFVQQTECGAHLPPLPIHAGVIPRSPVKTPIVVNPITGCISSLTKHFSLNVVITFAVSVWLKKQTKPVTTSSFFKVTQILKIHSCKQHSLALGKVSTLFSPVLNQGLSPFYLLVKSLSLPFVITKLPASLLLCSGTIIKQNNDYLNTRAEILGQSHMITWSSLCDCLAAYRAGPTGLRWFTFLWDETSSENSIPLRQRIYDLKFLNYWSHFWNLLLGFMDCCWQWVTARTENKTGGKEGLLYTFCCHSFPHYWM